MRLPPPTGRPGMLPPPAPGGAPSPFGLPPPPPGNMPISKLPAPTPMKKKKNVPTNTSKMKGKKK